MIQGRGRRNRTRRPTTHLKSSNRGERRSGLDLELNVVLERVRNTVAGEQHVVVTVELHPQQVAHGVVLPLNHKHASIRDLGVLGELDPARVGGVRRDDPLRNDGQDRIVARCDR